MDRNAPQTQTPMKTTGLVQIRPQKTETYLSSPTASFEAPRAPRVKRTNEVVCFDETTFTELKESGLLLTEVTRQRQEKALQELLGAHSSTKTHTSASGAARRSLIMQDPRVPLGNAPVVVDISGGARGMGVGSLTNASGGDNLFVCASQNTYTRNPVFERIYRAQKAAKRMQEALASKTHTHTSTDTHTRARVETEIHERGTPILQGGGVGVVRSSISLLPPSPSDQTPTRARTHTHDSLPPSPRPHSHTHRGLTPPTYPLPPTHTSTNTLVVRQPLRHTHTPTQMSLLPSITRTDTISSRVSYSSANARDASPVSSINRNAQTNRAETPRNIRFRKMLGGDGGGFGGKTIVPPTKG
eukprot:GDKI01048614.1.p1 GENE.GDKI01048614.1~~GDKI01048614.1.p1  ORF type:complete len:387 (+),score=93.72 GDKI01048614.1:89-1162(+)